MSESEPELIPRTLEEWEAKWEKEETEARNKGLLRYWFFHRIPDMWDSCRSKTHDAWYYIKCKLWYRYNVVKIESLPPTWHDPDTLMLFSVFQVFENFVKYDACSDWGRSNEEVKQVYNESFPGMGDERARDWQKIHDLYDWWMKYKDERHTYVEDMDEIENEKLCELIKLRGYLWS
jgi:hypothetical protein